MKQPNSEHEQGLLKALRQTEESYRALFRSNPHPMWIYDTQRLTFLAVNEAAVEQYGYSEEEFLGMTINDIRPPDEVPRLRAWMAEIGEGVCRSGLWRHRKKDGTILLVEISSHALEFGGRKARLVQADDVTERERVSGALRESEAKYRQLVDLMPAAVYACDCAGAIWFYNERAATLWGCRPKPGEVGREYCGCLQGLAAEGRAVPPEELPLALACRKGQSARNVEGLIERADGSRANVLVNVDPVRDGAGEVVGAISVLTDITERKRTRTALEKQNRRLGLLNEAAVQLLSAEEPERAMAGVYERIAGYFQTSGFLEFEASEPGEKLSLKSCVGMGEPGMEGGKTGLGRGEGIAETVAQQRQAMILGQVQQSGDPKAQRLKELGVQAYACFPLVVGERLLGTLSFASRQRESFEAEDVAFFETLASYLALAKERLRLRQELLGHAASLEQAVNERTSKLRELVAELEHMSYSIVHDMRAPLRSIQGYAAIIAQSEGQRLSPDSRELFERLVASTSRMDLLITDVLTYNRAVREQLVLQPVDVGKLLRSLLQSYPELQPERAEVRLEGEFPPVLGNEAGLTQCFSNLLNNAVKFVRSGARPQVRVWAEVVDSGDGTEGRAARNSRAGVRAERAAAGGQEATPTGSQLSTKQHQLVRIWVEDQGTGIPQGGQEKIFQIFQRMHGPEYEGTGIGLALVRKVAERMGGRVGVESEEGKGSRFWIELRIAE